MSEAAGGAGDQNLLLSGRCKERPSGEEEAEFCCQQGALLPWRHCHHKAVAMANKRDASDLTSCADKELTKPARRRPRRATSTAGRRSQKDKRRGPTPKRRDPKDKRRGHDEKKEGVTVKRTWSDGKRRWDKKHYCVFCRRPQVKIARHLLRKHADQQEVVAASALPTGSKQRHLLLEHLRCRGNYMHNIEVIRQGTGEIVPWRQPSEDVDARNYLPCPLCLGFFLRADLWKHQASCRKKLTSDPSRDSASTAEKTSDPFKDTTCDPTGDPADVRTPPEDPPPESSADTPKKRSRIQAAASRLLPISGGASESCSQVLHRMNQDHVSHQVKSDWLICKYGNKLMGSPGGSGRRYDYVSQKLRELGRFLLAAKSLDPVVGTLQDLLAPGRLSLALAAARKASGYRWTRPPLAVKTTLKTVCEIAIGESLQDGDWETAAKTTDFYHMLGREWDKLGLQDPAPNNSTPDPDTEGGAKMKNQLVQSGSEKEGQESGPDVLSQSRQVSCVVPPESRLQVPPPSVLVSPRKVRRRPWSSAEKEAVWRQLGVHVLVQSVPGKEVCQRCLDLEPVLRGRHWKDIKNQVHNQIQSQKKQQFHAQMDLQENQDHTDQNQKNQQQYQIHMDQQGEDQNQKNQEHQQDQENVQNKKKPQNHIQLDHQDQGHIQNHKKLQYLTRLDPQDDLQKQLYHMDQQTQDQQTDLDQNTSVLTGTSYRPDGPHQDPGISQYPLPHRTLGPHVDQLLTRTQWTDPPLIQHYRNLDPGGPAGPGQVHF
nr:uncharacterized protein LOC110002817 isoform X2 [Labrus bergylta]